MKQFVHVSTEPAKYSQITCAVTQERMLVLSAIQSQPPDCAKPLLSRKADFGPFSQHQMIYDLQQKL
jgi:hypothetical protein